MDEQCGIKMVADRLNNYITLAKGLLEEEAAKEGIC